MQVEWNSCCGRRLKTYVVDTAVIGTGCAGYNAAGRLAHYGCRDVAIFTEGVNMGTSRNAGSDKQTYYKLSLASGQRDSVLDMARTCFDGQCMDGDHALVEAALSAKCFYRLCELGVPFPQNRYGEYIGYRTDHDPACRATSIGPKTSLVMTRALQALVEEKEIPTFDGFQVISILTDADGICGLLCLNRHSLGMPEERYVLVRCANVVMATGGPAGIYSDVCYPPGHFGASGMAYRAGARGKNLTEWQYGLASIAPRWNVSGTYMQVLPRFVSTDPNGENAREFLQDYIPDPADLLERIFLKGYQWPFDVRKARDGSSLIDLIVYNESKVRGRRVFLDFRQNPLGDAFSLSLLRGECRAYLERAGALFGAPIDRLSHMNSPAVDFYRERGVNLHSEMLEIAMCAQHNNGGIDVDAWWQSDVTGLFVVGEAAGTHGVYRPGGSALNAGQAGSDRAALFIARRGRRLSDLAKDWLKSIESELETMLAFDCGRDKPDGQLCARIREAAEDMSRYGGPVRDVRQIERLLDKTRQRLETLRPVQTAPQELPRLYRYLDMLYAQLAYLGAMLDYARAGGRSRGSALYPDAGGEAPNEKLSACRFRLDDGRFAKRVQNIRLNGTTPEAIWRDVRPIPVTDDFFENVWRGYRNNENVF